MGILKEKLVPIVQSKGFDMITACELVDAIIKETEGEFKKGNSNKFVFYVGDIEITLRKRLEIIPGVQSKPFFDTEEEYQKWREAFSEKLRKEPIEYKSVRLYPYKNSFVTLKLGDKGALSKDSSTNI